MEAEHLVSVAAQDPTGASPDRTAHVRETHSGVVLLVGDLAYKIKKPVDLGFLDFRTMAAREHACRRELELNRRLAPDCGSPRWSSAGPTSMTTCARWRG
jgi:aminoglycoside phosphotransferase family enzyme